MTLLVIRDCPEVGNTDECLHHTDAISAVMEVIGYRIVLFRYDQKNWSGRVAGELSWDSHLQGRIQEFYRWCTVSHGVNEGNVLGSLSGKWQLAHLRIITLPLDDCSTWQYPSQSQLILFPWMSNQKWLEDLWQNSALWLLPQRNTKYLQEIGVLCCENGTIWGCKKL